MRKYDAYSLCHRYVNQYVGMQTKDGQVYNGVIEKVDRDRVYLLVPKGGSWNHGRSPSPHDRNRESSYYGYGYNPYLGYPYSYYPYPYPRRRFRRLALPLSFLTGIALGGLFL